MAVSPLRQRIDWEKYWFDNDCANPEVSKSKLLCKAYQICIEEVIPSLIPLTLDDFLIQILLLLLTAIIFEGIRPEKRDKKMKLDDNH